MCEGWQAIVANCVLDIATFGKPDGAIPYSLGFEKMTMDKAQVDFLHEAVLHLPGELLVGKMVFGDEDYAGGIAINPVDGSKGARLALPFPISGYGISQGVLRIAGDGMNHLASGFVDCKEVVVFIEDVEGKVLPSNLAFFSQLER